MFDQPFKIRYVHHFQRKDNGLNRKVHLFAFRGKNNTSYLIECEEFECNFVAIKYFQKCDRDKPTNLKFGRLTNLGEATRVISTCIQAMLILAKQNPYYSFGFIGSPTYIDPIKAEEAAAKDKAEGKAEGKAERIKKKDVKIDNTKRFRVYSYLMINSFAPINYQHVVDPSRSTYMIINRHIDESKSKKLNDLISKIQGIIPS
jgi:hypothetical protein